VIAERVLAVRERIARAAERASRPPGEVRLVAVSKTHPAEAVRAAFAAGVRDLGENRVQEAEPKIAATADLAPSGLRWHVVGHLQSNKARRAATLFEVVESVDSLDLALRLARVGTETGRAVPTRATAITRIRASMILVFILTSIIVIFCLRMAARRSWNDARPSIPSRAAEGFQRNPAERRKASRLAA
jgi:hypothetical protein